MTHAAEAALQGMEDDDDPLAVIIRKACSRELTDLGLTFNSLNIKVVQSEVAESRRRQSAAEAQANADIVTAQQARRAKEAQLEAERVISDKQRELEQTKASNAALIAEAEAKKQTALGIQRVAELEATQIAQARADAERMRIGAEASARAEAIRITTVAQANAESIQKVNEAIKAGGESYFRYRQIEMIPAIPRKAAPRSRQRATSRASSRQCSQPNSCPAVECFSLPTAAAKRRTRCGTTAVRRRRPQPHQRPSSRRQKPDSADVYVAFCLRSCRNRRLLVGSAVRARSINPCSSATYRYC
jgi:hypothetical protein